MNTTFLNQSQPNNKTTKMKKSKIRSLLILLLFSLIGYTQKTSIEFESNGRTSENTRQNPFKKFIGEWTLKNDDWTRNWGDKTETIKIPNHHTTSQEINTNNSLLSIIDGPKPNGHIFWSYNPNTKEVYHLSSFGSIRAGNGKGTISSNGDIKLKLFFEGEPKGTYRIYNYKWINDNEYHMKSVQYSEKNIETGLFYEGYFIRVNNTTTSNPKEEIIHILKTLDNNELSIEKQLEVYSDNIVHMAPNTKAITDKQSLKTYLEQQRQFGTSNMKHHIISIEIIDDKILMRGEVKGTFHPKNNDKEIKFETKNIFVFSRENGKLKIQKVIYNMSPVE